MNGVVPLAAVVLTPWWVWFAVPGGDPLLASFGGLLFSLVGTVMAFAMVSATFPRSAAPYVANSRVLHPAIGWPSEVLMWLGWIMALALYPSFMITWALIPGLYTLGVSTGNEALIGAAQALTTPYWALLVGVIILLLALLLGVAGTRWLVRHFQLPITILAFLGIAALLGTLLAADRSQLLALLPKYLGKSYDDVISYASSNASEALAPYSYTLGIFLLSLGFTAGSFNTYWNAWASGEVKRASELRVHALAMALPSLLIGALVISTLVLASKVAGDNFLRAMTLILSTNPGFFGAPAVAGFAGSSTMTLIPMILADNPAVQFLIMLGMIASVLTYLPVTMLIISREWFAWAFDRLLPSKFAQVSERFHTPVVSLVTNFVIGLVFLVIFAFYGAYLGFFTTVAWDTTLVPIALLCLSAALLPLRRGFWEVSPVRNLRIGPLPLITVVGLIGAFYNGLAVWVYSTTPALGFGLPSTLVLVVTFLIPFVLYWIVRSVRKRQGIDIDLVFKSIPPE
jgi:amino acid transporter